MKLDPAFSIVKKKQEYLGINNLQIRVGTILFQNSLDFNITPKLRIEAEDLGLSKEILSKVQELLKFAITLDCEFYISDSKLRIRKIPVYDSNNIEEVEA